uniref:Uncharacterized protein n=1 Tax=Hemiselmis tepida TaxID=464990 RepID=A0A7S0YNS5_9CRYP|mmetsp:Transcript_1634/g.4110  ORF Transcript_1634/g.4110 Transcript_1634/m.4110 type:complete len:129 (+) Transcript_1634:80-466(+)|eukprot:CAMPEP_0174916684 /NCGR_PEP_ID=MMETSP1355-20121228/1974_1 /TAXON_ID=464990 /ORGANISM="Hemiselmis tepida, Strain CCMP443" /LENGTH=128 /DNA_ID=CAMNT_0016161703 /DNA_START=80 /DNA_END=466 /DNA_ORIENTATION=-
MGMTPRDLLTAIGGVSLTLMFSILACTIQTSDVLPANWWPMFVVGTYALSPFPIIIFGNVSGDFMDGGHTITYWAYFTTGWIVTISFGIPCILYHANVIAFGNCFFSLAASFTFYGMIVYKIIQSARG